MFHLTVKSICVGEYSIKAYCERHGVFNWFDYISLSALRRAGVNPTTGLPCQAIIYVHSKLLMVDDEHVIIGSANVNDRSMAGWRDSELALHWYQPNSTVIRDLRLRLWGAYLGEEKDDIQGMKLNLSYHLGILCGLSNFF